MLDRAAVKARVEARLAERRQKIAEAAKPKPIHFNRRTMVKVTLPPKEMPDGTKLEEAKVEMSALPFGRDDEGNILVFIERPNEKAKDYERQLALYARLPNYHGGNSVLGIYPISAFVSDIGKDYP